MNSHIAFELEPLFDQGFFSDLDYHFARTMDDIYHGLDPVVLASCALVSRALSLGNICCHLSIIADTTVKVAADSDLVLVFPHMDLWLKRLEGSPIVSDGIKTPLVLDSEGRLFFAKYYDFQDRLARNIAHRQGSVSSCADHSLLKTLISSEFDLADRNVDPQVSAVKNALYRNFTIISGGPGTGKTFVSGLIKKIFISSCRHQLQREPVVLCVAPTGKAASKMEHGSTIHSVLKPRSDRTGFHHHKQNPLFADMVIIDEASMIDVVLLTRLFEAIPNDTRIVLLGDRHQLASVQAGSVFSEICATAALSQDIFVLTYNFRSKGKTGIENLAKAVNDRDENRVHDILTSGQYPDIIFEDTSDKEKSLNRIQTHIKKGYAGFNQAPSIESSLEVMDEFKILCAHNSGEYGTLQINHVCENILRSEAKFDIKDTHFKQIVMVKTNDYQKGLFNGDTGVITREKGGRLTFFIRRQDQIQTLSATDMPEYNSAFAITIHKSQGSEFAKVLILIPEKLSPVVTQQLLYTGITRAKKQVIIAGDTHIIKQAVKLSAEHNSGVSAAVEKHIHHLKI